MGQRLTASGSVELNNVLVTTTRSVPAPVSNCLAAMPRHCDS
jgi:hypothetical protein